MPQTLLTIALVFGWDCYVILQPGIQCLDLGPRKRFPHDTGIRLRLDTISFGLISEKEYTDERLCCFLRRMESF